MPLPEPHRRVSMDSSRRALDRPQSTPTGHHATVRLARRPFSKSAGCARSTLTAWRTSSCPQPGLSSISLCPQLPSTAAPAPRPLASRAIVALWRVSGRQAQRRGLSDLITPCVACYHTNRCSMMMTSLLGDALLVQRSCQSRYHRTSLSLHITALLRPDRKHWLQAQVEEWGCLGPEGTKTIPSASLQTSPLIA
jgi:hypothetical protein